MKFNKGDRILVQRKPSGEKVLWIRKEKISAAANGDKFVWVKLAKY